jgi:uncharacterized membrane protein
MTDSYLVLKLAHVIGACVLFGTGVGIAFFMWMAHRTADVAVLAATARIVIVADAVFTATAVIAQPITGAALARVAGLRRRDRDFRANDRKAAAIASAKTV